MLTRRDKNFVWRVDDRSLDLKGMKVAIVGRTGGIGRALCRFLVSRGAAVLAIGQTFRDSDVPGIKFIKADLSPMREAQRVGSLLTASNPARRGLVRELVRRSKWVSASIPLSGS